MIFYAGVNFGLKGDGNTALNWSVAVLIFRIGLIQIALYLKEN